MRFGARKITDQWGGDCRADLVLQIEHVRDRTIVALRPDRGARLRIDELRADTDTVGFMPHATLYNVARAEFFRCHANIHVAPVVKTRPPRDDRECAPCR